KEKVSAYALSRARVSEKSLPEQVFTHEGIESRGFVIPNPTHGRRDEIARKRNGLPFDKGWRNGHTYTWRRIRLRTPFVEHESFGGRLEKGCWLFLDYRAGG